MRMLRPFFALAAALAAAALGPPALGAQGVTTGAVRGTVTTDGGAPVENAQVQVVTAELGRDLRGSNAEDDTGQAAGGFYRCCGGGCV